MKNIGKQEIIELAISFVLALIVVYSGFLQILFMFLVVGAIPGTTFSIPPTIMLVGFIALAWLFIFRISLTKITDAVVEKRQILEHASRHPNLPKRRMGRIKADPAR